MEETRPADLLAGGPSPSAPPVAAAPRSPLLVKVAAAATAALALIPVWALLQMRAGQWDEIHRIDGELFGAMMRHARFSSFIVALLAVAILFMGLAVLWGSRPARWLACAALVAAAYGFWHRGLYVLDPLASNAAATLCILMAGVLGLSRTIDGHFDGRAWQKAREGRGWTRLGAMIALRFERIPLLGAALAVIALGVALRLATIWTMDIWADGGTYSAMGKAWMEHHAFLMPYGDVTTWDGAPAYSHHYPPMYPLYLGLVYSVIGFGVLQTKIAAVAISVAALAVVYATTQSLFGRDRALVVTVILSLEPHLIWSTGTGFSESLVLLFFAVTLWAILKSLAKPPYIVIAGLAAGLAYLTRSSVGPFFVVAGVGGLLWRFHFLRWRVFANKWYLIAIAIFAGLALYWADRNVRLFGGYPTWDGPGSLFGPGGAIVYLAASPEDLLLGGAGCALLAGLFWMGRPRGGTVGQRRAYWCAGVAAGLVAVLAWAWTARNGALHGWPPWETSTDIAGAARDAAAQPDQFAKALGYKSLLFAVYLLWYALFFLPELRRSARRIREEGEMALWLAVGLVFVTAWIISSQLWVREHTLIFWFDNHRYVVIAFLPLMWLALGRSNPRSGATKARAAALGLTLLMFTAFTFASPTQNSTDEAVASLNGKLQSGMELALDGGTNKYAQFTYMPRFDVRVDGYQPGLPCQRADHPDFLISVNKMGTDYPCYRELDRFVQGFASGANQTSIVYKWDPPPGVP